MAPRKYDTVPSNPAHLLTYVQEKEKELIKSYKTTEREFGYNIAKGGNGGNNKKVSKIKKYDLKGNLIQIYENATMAALSVKGNIQYKSYVL